MAKQNIVKSDKPNLPTFMRNISLNNTWQLAYFLPKNCYIIMH